MPIYIESKTTLLFPISLPYVRFRWKADVQNIYLDNLKKIALNSSLFLAAVAISLFLCDVVITFLSFPSEVPLRV